MTLEELEARGDSCPACDEDYGRNSFNQVVCVNTECTEYMNTLEPEPDEDELDDWLDEEEDDDDEDEDPFEEAMGVIY